MEASIILQCAGYDAAGCVQLDDDGYDDDGYADGHNDAMFNVYDGELYDNYGKNTA